MCLLGENRISPANHNINLPRTNNYHSRAKDCKNNHNYRNFIVIFTNNNTFFGYMGITCALVLGNFGAAYGTAKSGVGVCSAVTVKPELLFKSIVPIVMAGILGIYGLIIAVIIANAVSGVDGGRPAYGQFSAMAHFGGGLACGLSGLAAGMAIGVVGDSLTRASAEQPKLFVGMVLILIFAEALGLYGLIVGLILASKA